MPEELNDHDLLITFRAEVKTQMNNVLLEIKDIKDNTTGTLTDHEKRLRMLENIAQNNRNRISNFWVAMGIYTAGVVSMIALMLFHIFR